VTTRTKVKLSRTVFFLLVSNCICATAGDWPQWLGPTRNNHAGADEKIPNKLSSEPKAIWKIKIGGGFSSPIVASGKVIYFDENGEKEIVHQLDGKTGKEIWQTSIANRYGDEWGFGPRSTPFVNANRVYAQSCNGEFRCLNFADGTVFWGTSFETNFGVKFLGSKANEGTASRRGNDGSGIADGDVVILPVGSTNGATLVCFDKRNGKILWKSGTDEAAYSSLQIATMAGVKQVISFTADALMSVEFQTGKPLWRIPLKTNAKRHAATPVIFGDSVIVNSHTIGLVCEKISRDGEQLKAEQLWANKALKINLSTPVLVGNFLYGQGQDKNFVCVDAKTGALKWDHAGFGKQNSSTIALGDKLLVLTDEGQLILISGDSEKYAELGRAQVCGKNWNFPAYADGKLYVRDAHELICYELK